VSDNAEELSGNCDFVIPVAQCASRPSPVTKGAQRLAAGMLRRAVILLTAALDSNLELSVHWKREIKRLVELLLTAEDLETVQSLTVQLQRALYLHIEQIQRELVEARPACPNDSFTIEISLSDPCSLLPKPADES
jgi:hypothetical protein